MNRPSIISLVFILLALCLLPHCRGKNPTTTGVIDSTQSDIPTVIIKYDQPINGYMVTVKLHPLEGEHYGPAEMQFSNANNGFTVNVDSFDKVHFNYETTLHDGDTITLHYTPLPERQVISPDCTFFFSDVDFDGTKELIVREPLAGPRGIGAYHIYELDGTQREDKPLSAIDDMTDFNTAEKSITLNYYYGIILGFTSLKYCLQEDGLFALTDSTHTDYKMQTINDIITDSVRVHYHRQGDKMVLIKTEVFN